MGDHTPAVGWFQQLVTEEIDRRGTQRAVADLVGVTQQTVSNWAKGRMPMPGEAARFAAAIDSDIVEFIGALWPEIAEHDRLARLRSQLAVATDAEIRDVERYVATRVGRRPRRVKAPADASPRTPTAGSPPAPSGDDPARPAGTGSRGASAAGPRPAPRRGRARRSGPGTNPKGES